MASEAKINTDRLLELVREMVNIYSPSGKEEGVSDFLSGYLHDKGFSVIQREVTEGRRNVEVLFSDQRPDIAFIGHIDTVSAFDIEHFEFEQKDGRIYGLGTADMKAGCAAMVEAFTAFSESGGSTEKAGLFLVVGEEETGDGTAALLDARSFPTAIVAEPTDMVPCFGHYGYMEMLIRAFGRRRHASMAGREYNAIFSMLRMLLKLGGVVEVEHPETILNIRDINSSAAGFAVPGSCEAWVDLHVPPRGSVKRLSRELEKIAGSSLAASTVNSYEIEFPTVAEGYMLDEEGDFGKTLKAVYDRCGLDWAPGAFMSHSDANMMRQAGCEPVILGPGQLAMAHTRDESVEFEQVVEAAGVYLELLKSL